MTLARLAAKPWQGALAIVEYGETAKRKIEPGLPAASGEAESDWVEPAARFQNFQATSAEVVAKGTEETKGEETQFSQLVALMVTRNAQNEQGMAQMREAREQTQQAQAQFMQLMG